MTLNLPIQASRFSWFFCFYNLLMSPSVAVAELTLTLVNSPDLGIIYSGVTGRQFILNTNGTMSGNHAGDYINGAVAGQITVQDSSSPKSINILVDNISTMGGVTVNKALCSYNGGSQQSCDVGGMNVTSVSTAALKLGLDITTNTAHSGGDSANVSMDVSVIYP